MTTTVQAEASPRAAHLVRPAFPRRHLRWRPLLIALAALYVGGVLALPVAVLVLEVFRAGIGDVLRELATPPALQALGLSVAIAIVAVVISTVFGIAAGIVLVRQRFVGRAALDAAIDLSLSVSPVMIGLAMLLMFGRTGWMAPLLDPLGMQVAFAIPGVVLCTLFVTLPFTAREVAYVLEEIGTDEEQVAETLGATPWTIFRRVTLPNISHGLRLGIVLTTARALGEFGAVLVVGGSIAGRTQTATTFIYAAAEERRTAAAMGMALVLAVVSMLLLTVLTRLRRSNEA